MISSDYFSRQAGLFDPELIKNVEVSIVGCGGVGSWTAFSLAKLGFRKFRLFDMDTIEEGNIASQLYRESEIGLSKVLALKELLGDFFGEELDKLDIHIYTTEFQNAKQELLKSQIVVSGLDSLEARAALFDTILDEDSQVQFFVDGRMGGEYARVFGVDMFNEDKIQKYKKTLERTVVDPTPCSEKAIVYNTQIIGSIISSLIKNFLAKKEYPFEFIFDMSIYWVNSIL